MTRPTRRGPWLPEEDGTLIQLVRSQGPNNWVRISQHMQHRSPKQCRERYHQNLKPSLNHEPISAEEGEMIEQLVQEMGKRWAEIARRLGNRSDNAVKNWWNGSMNRRKRHYLPQTNGSRSVGQRTQPISATRHPLPDFLQKPHHGHNTYQQQEFPPIQSLVHSRSNIMEYDQAISQRFAPDIRLPAHTGNSAQFLINSRLPDSSILDQRLPPLPDQSMSAPSSLQATPDTFSFRHLHPHSQRQFQGLRPSPLESRYAPQTEWQLPRLVHAEPTLVSPAGTEYSTSTSFQQAPSLISDNQSHYSVSPKTVSSPRPGLPASIDTSAQKWASTQRRNSLGSSTTERAPIHDEGYVSAIPTSAIGEVKLRSIPPDPMLHSSLLNTVGKLENNEPSSPLGSARDTRMTLSNLMT